MKDILRQSTAVTLVFGPFSDSTDGDSPETTLTISQADIRLSKNGAAFAQSNNAAGATHMENGFFGVPLDATDTGTLGKLFVYIREAGALTVWREYTVVPANVYDSLVLGTDKLEVDATLIEGADATTVLRAQVATELGTYDGPTNAELAAALGALNDLSAADVNAEVVDALATDAYAELAAVPAANAPLADKINFLFALARNKITNNGTTMALRNDADSGDIATAPVSEAGSTVTRGEFT